MVQTRKKNGRYSTNGKGLNGRLEFMKEMQGLVENAATTRSDFIQALSDRRRDVNDEAGYPDEISLQDYQNMYDREGVATRVVEVLPKESWRTQPVLFETEDTDEETPFEKAWLELSQSLRGEESWYNGDNGNPLWEHLLRADILSGIGSFGILLFGLDDGRSLDTEATFKGGRKVTFLRSFSQAQVSIESLEKSLSSPRFGLPTMYNVTFDSEQQQSQQSPFTGMVKQSSEKVHWSRTLHVADNLGSSEILGTPRMKPVYNRLADLKKVYAGSGEMYWRGAFPGLSLETHPQLGGDVELDTATLKAAAEQYMNTLQRYIISSGMNVKSLAPQVVDPTPQIESYLNAIAIRLGIPMRVLMGSERGELASSQDNKTWNGRLKIRQNFHITDRIIVPLVDRFIQLGVLPKPDKGYSVVWPDLDTISEAERAGVAGQQTQAISTFIAGNGEALVEPTDFLAKVLGFSQEEAVVMFERAKKGEPLLAQGAWMTEVGEGAVASKSEDETKKRDEAGLKKAKKVKNPLQSGMGGQVKKASKPK